MLLLLHPETEPPESAKCLRFVAVLFPEMFMFTQFSIFICSILRSVDLSTTTTDSKQFQELLLERTKAFAAQTEALKSSNSDGKFSSLWLTAFVGIVSTSDFYSDK